MTTPHTARMKQRVRELLAMALAAAPLAAGAASGQFTFVVGEVTLTKANGQRATPAKGTAVEAGDRIGTGADGMAQLTMVDNARLSLRPGTQFQIEKYPDKKESNEGAVLNLVKGTLRTFTGLIAEGNRENFVMKTRVATVGIRGSGNILYACEGEECDKAVASSAKPDEGITVNHTIEGSHAITNIVAGAAPGLPAQQGGAQTVITGPGQTVLVAGNLPPRYIPMPRFIADAAVNVAAAKTGTGTAAAAESTSASSAAAASGETRNFSPGDTPAVPITQQTSASVATTTPTFVTDVSPGASLSKDPVGLRDIVIAAGSPFLGQARQADTQFSGNELRGYISYPVTIGGVQPAIVGGSMHEFQNVVIGDDQILLGRFDNAALGIFGSGTATPIPGSIHWAAAPSGYPVYLADVLTGVAAYTLAAATSPTNQYNTAGRLGSATINVDFSNRTLGLQASLTLPVAGTNAGGSWQLSASNVPFSFNTFFASTTDNLVITNGTGQSSRTSGNLSGSFEGSFVGSGLSGAIFGYGIADQTAASPVNWNFVTGVAALTGPRQNPAAPYREGRVSDSQGLLGDFLHSYSTTDRPGEVVVDAQGRATSFSAPYVRLGPHATYSLGTAQVVESGVDPETGLVWGRWGNGTATVALNGRSENLFLGNSSLHYIFAGEQTGPVALPLTGTATYDVIGSTRPTDYSGHVGSLNSATLNANFTDRTVDASVNISINNQTWNGAASRMPIFREQYFSAYTGTPIAGIPNPAPLVITCTPGCGVGASGSFDGFFTGRTGQRAGMAYDLGGNQGVVAFGRRGG